MKIMGLLFIINFNYLFDQHYVLYLYRDSILVSSSELEYQYSVDMGRFIEN